MSAFSNLLVKLGLDAKGFEEGIHKANLAIRDIRKSEKDLTEFGNKFKDIGGKLTMGLSVPLAAAGGIALKFATDFNGAMANVATLIPGNIERVKELKSAIQTMAVDVGKHTGDLAGGLYQVISAFGDTADTTKILEINARAAAAGLATTTEAINLTSAVTKGYGDVSAAAVQKAADLAFQTVKLGQTTFPELAAAMGKVIPIAATLGVSQEELFGAMATLTGVTGSTTEVTTQLRGAMNALLKPTETMKDLITAAGYASGEAMLQQNGLVGSMNLLSKAAEGNKEQLGKAYGQVEALNAVFALTGTQADTFSEKFAAMGNVTGKTSEAFKEQAEGINKTGFTLEQVSIKAEVMAQKFGDAIAPALNDVLAAATPLIDGMQSLANWFAELPSPIQKTIVGIAALVAAIGPALYITGQLAHSIVAIKSAIAGLGGLFSGAGGALSTFSGLVSAAAPIAIALGAAWVTWEGLKGLYSVISDLLSPLGGMLDLVKDLLQPVKEWATNIGLSETALKGLKDGLLNALGPLGYFIDDAYLMEKIDWGGAIKEGLGPIFSLTAALTGLKGLLGVYPEMDEAAKKLSDTLRDETIETNKSRLEREAAAKAADIYKRKEEESADATEKAGKAAAKAAEDFRGLRETLSDIEKQKSAEKFVDGWVDARRQVGMSLDEMAQGAEDLVGKFEEAKRGAYDLGEAMRDAAMADVWGSAAGGLLIFREGIDEVPGWITDSVDQANEGILQSGKEFFDRQKKQIESWKNQVSTIISDLGKSIADAVWSIFDDGGEGAKLQEQEDALRESLAGRGQEWTDYQAEIAEKFEEASADYAATLAEEERSLADSLSDRKSRYGEEMAGLRDALAERVQAYEEFCADVAERLSEMRQEYADELAEEMDDYQDLLEEKADRLKDYIKDAKKNIDRLRKKNEDDVDDEIQDTGRKLKDKQLALKREREDTEEKIRRLLAAGKRADSQEIRDLEIKLSRKEEDYAIFEERQLADLQEYIEEHAAKLKQEELDIQESLARRKLDYDQDVADATERHEKVTADLKTKLTEEETALAASLVTKGTALETFKTETLAKQQALTDKWTAYQESAVADFETIKTEAKAKLTTQETELAASLATQKTAWTTFVTDVNTELAKIEEDAEGNSIFGRVATAFGTMLEGMGQSIVRFGAEYLVGKLFKWLVTDLLDGILPKLSAAFGSIFGVGGSAASGAAGAAGSAGGAAAGAAGTGAGGIAGSAASTGWMAALGLAFGGISAASGVIGNFQNAKQETSLNAIELNTRETKHALMGEGGPEAGGILGVQWLIKANTEYTYQSLDSVKNTLWEMKPMLSDLAWIWTPKMEGWLASIDARLNTGSVICGTLDDIYTETQGMHNEMKKVVEVNVRGFSESRDIGWEIAKALKTQGALA